MVFSKKNMKMIDNTAMALVIIGAINWGLTLFDFNLVTLLADLTVSMLSSIVYGLVGLSGLRLGFKEYF